LSLLYLGLRARVTWVFFETIAEIHDFQRPAQQQCWRGFVVCAGPL